MVIVSHDRAFLERTVTDVLELDEHDHRATIFGGGWSAYQAERATARRTPRGLRRLRGRNGPSSRPGPARAPVGHRRGGKEKKQPRDNDKAQRDFRINRTEKLASRARRTERALDALDAVDKPWEGWDLRFTIKRRPGPGAVVARLDGAVVERGDFRLGPSTWTSPGPTGSALTGPNGAGKTTLVERILGRLPLAAGTRWLGRASSSGSSARTAGSLRR